MTSKIVNKNGFVVPNKIANVSGALYEDINNLVVFQPKDISYTGTLRWSGIINNEINAFGIELSWEMKEATNGTFNSFSLFKCSTERGIVVTYPIKFLKLNKENRSIEEQEIKNHSYNDIESKYNKDDLVVIRTNCYLRIGKVCGSGTINGIECHRINFIGEVKTNLFASIDVLGTFANENGLVNVYEETRLTYNISEGDFPYKAKINERMNFQYNNEKMDGTLKWKGFIDGLRCVAIEPDEADKAADFRKVFNDEDAYWTVICLDNLDPSEVFDPHDENIYTYFKLKAYVRSNNQEGSVEKYVVNKERKFYYGVKWEYEDKLEYVDIDDLKCASPKEIGSKAFFKVEDPAEFGIETVFKVHDFVKLLPTTKNKLKGICAGEIVWMGFDQESSFKFLIQLENPVENGHSGIIFGQALYDIPYMKGILVFPSCVVPLDAPINIGIKKEKALIKHSEIVEEYVGQRYAITTGEDSGIQGDKNSCYLDTSIFAMFTFQEVFDNILFAPKQDSNAKILQQCLGQYIIYPLRKHGFVSFDRVELFRNKLGELFPGKMFVHTERDPEELLETLFHLLTPNDPLLITFHLKTHIKQSCFLTQLFYLKNGSQLNSVNIKDMLDWTFLESDILMNKPPRCLILQLPRHGNKFKKFTEVNIRSKLEITHLIRYCEQKCSDCTKRATLFCKECSDIKNQYIYFCVNHKYNCKHDKYSFTDDIEIHDKENGPERYGSLQNKINGHKEEKILFNGRVVMELFAVLCIDKTHYVAYVKTGEVSHRWVFFDSMASSDGSSLHPLVREADISRYVETGDSKEFNEDVQRIKQFAFVCFYKNPTMEFYEVDFNHTEG